MCRTSSLRVFICCCFVALVVVLEQADHRGPFAKICYLRETQEGQLTEGIVEIRGGNFNFERTIGELSITTFQNGQMQKTMSPSEHFLKDQFAKNNCRSSRGVNFSSAAAVT